MTELLTNPPSRHETQSIISRADETVTLVARQKHHITNNEQMTEINFDYTYAFYSEKQIISLYFHELTIVLSP